MARARAGSYPGPRGDMSVSKQMSNPSQLWTENRYRCFPELLQPFGSIRFGEAAAQIRVAELAIHFALALDMERVKCGNHHRRCHHDRCDQHCHDGLLPVHGPSITKTSCSYVPATARILRDVLIPALNHIFSFGSAFDVTLRTLRCAGPRSGLRKWSNSLFHAIPCETLHLSGMCPVGSRSHRPKPACEAAL